MMTLPFPPRKVELLVFWCAMTTVSCLSLGVFILLGLPGTPVLLAIAVLLILALVGLINRRLPLFAYRAWNKAARIMADQASRWVLKIAFYFVLTPADKRPSSLSLERPESVKSLWHGYSTAGMKPDSDSPVSSRILLYALRPFLLLISNLHTESQDAEAQNIYTLF